MRVVLLGHGSRDPRHAATLRAVAAGLRDRNPRATVETAFLDHCPPTLAELVTAGTDAAVEAEQTVVVPMLLTAAFHADVDVPAAITAAEAARPGVRFVASDVLGPAPELVAAMDRRLREAGTGIDPDDPDGAATGVLVVAAGSSNDGARAAVADLTSAWLGPRGAHAFAAGPGPSVPDAVRALVVAGRRRIAVAPYVLAPGVLPDRAWEAARSTAGELGVEVVLAAPIGDAPELLDLVEARVGAAAS